MNEMSLHDGENTGRDQRSQPARGTEGARPAPAPLPARAVVDSMQPAHGNAQQPNSREGGQHPDRSLTSSFEPFDSRYLDALVEEGINLDAFLGDWCRAMRDDLDRLCELRRDGDFDRLPKLFHRLSGALGLVGAQSLMDALRRAPSQLSERDSESIDVLAARTRTLIAQLEAVHDEHRSTRL